MTSEQIREAIEYADRLWPTIEGCFHVLIHSDSSLISSVDGAKEILWIFKDWVENNGGWRDIQNAPSGGREAAIHRLIFLGAKTFTADHNLDMNCEPNNGVGQEDIKISRGNDKTVIEVKLSSNPGCLHGYEVQLPRYSEAEHTKNMIFVLVRVDDREWDLGQRNDNAPDVVMIDARKQVSASKL